MTYQSVVNGATGIQYFVREGLNSFPKSVSTWNECGRMALEIAEITPWLLSDEQTYAAESSSKNIAVTSRLKNNQLLVLIVNKINEPLQSEIRITGIGNSRARVIFENRTIAVNWGTISDPLPAYGSQVYIIDLKKKIENIVPWSKNMIKDPGFEDISSPGVPAACYARSGDDRGATYFLDSREHIEGNHSLRIVTPKDSNSLIIKFFPVSVGAGKSYIISLWSKADAEQRLTLKNAFKSSLNVAFSERPQFVEISLGSFGKSRFIPKNEWNQFVTFVTIPTDTTEHFKTNVILKMPGQGVAWFDMLQMIEDPLQDKSKK